jgi:hypothetical protein
MGSHFLGKSHAQAYHSFLLGQKGKSGIPAKTFRPSAGKYSHFTARHTTAGHSGLVPDDGTSAHAGLR